MAKEKQVKVVGDAPELQDIVPAFQADKDRNKFFWSCWSSPEAFAKGMGELNPKTAWHDSPWKGEDGFHGPSMTNAIEMARKGWQDGAERAEKIRDKINAAHPHMKQFVRWGIAGAYPNVARAVAGNPMHMKLPVSAETRRRPVITLLSDNASNCMTDKRSLINRAAVVAAIVDQIEAAGFSCHVVAVACATDVNNAGDMRACTVVTVKESDQAADVARLAYGLGHVAMFRRLTFASWSHDHFASDLSNNLGYPSAVQSNPEAHVYALPRAQGGPFDNEEQAATAGLEYLLKALREQGCPAFPNDEERAA